MPYRRDRNPSIPQKQNPGLSYQDIINQLTAALGENSSSAPVAGGIFQNGPSMGLGSPEPVGPNFLQKLLDQQRTGQTALELGQLGGILGTGADLDQGEELTDLQKALAEIDSMINAMAGGTAASAHSVSGGIKKAYGAQIAGIKDLNQDAREDTKIGSKEVRKMYRALQRSYNNAAKREMKAGKNTAAQLQNLGAGSANAASEAAAALNAQNVAAAQALGAPDIAAQLNAEVNSQQQATANQAISQAGRSARTALGTSDNERKYYNTQGTTSRLEGTNRAADMYAQLQDYLEANGNKINEIAGQRSAALAGAESQMAGAQSEVLADMIAKKMQLLGMAEEARQFDIQNQPEMPEDPYAKMFPGMALSNQLASSAPENVQVALQQLLNDPAMQTGQWKSPKGQLVDLRDNNPSGIQQWLLDNKETDSFDDNSQLMALLTAIIQARLQGHPGAIPVESPLG